MEVVLLFGLIIGLMLIGVPIAFALGLSSITFLLLHSGTSLSSMAQTLFSVFDGHYTLLAIPFFILVAWPGASSGFPVHWWVISRAAWRLPVSLPA